MKVEITWKFIFDLDYIIKTFKEKPTSAIKDCVRTSLYIRKVNNVDSCIGCDKNSAENNS